MNLLSVGVPPHEVLVVHRTPHHGVLSVSEQDAVRIPVVPLNQYVSRSPFSDLSDNSIAHLAAEWLIVDTTGIDAVDEFLSTQIAPDEYEAAFASPILTL